MQEIAISVQEVSMMFHLSKDKIMSAKEFLIKAIQRQIVFEEFWALKNVSFEVAKGEVFGLIGLNGSGKSTLLKIIAGVYKPTIGAVGVNGEIAPLLELGAGFDPEFSARDNILMNGAMFGHSPKEMEEKYDAIMAFSELEEFKDVAVKNFSSGMVARLGFAIATSVQPDILIVDEILGVGDYRFQAKCEDRIDSMIKQGATVLMVSHSTEKMKSMCSRAMLLHRGEVICIGDVADVCKEYQK